MLLVYAGRSIGAAHSRRRLPGPAPARSITVAPHSPEEAADAARPAQLIGTTRITCIHPLHHPSEHLEPMVYVRGRGAMHHRHPGPRVHRRPRGALERQRRPRARGAGGGGRRADARAGLLLALRRARRISRPSSWPTSSSTLALSSNMQARVLHLGRRAESNESAFKTARFYWKAKGKARQGQDHRAHQRLPRRDAAGDERHRHGAVLEDVRAARAGLRPHPDLLSVSPGRRQAGRRRARPRRGCSRKPSCAKARTRWRPSSPSPFTAAAASSIPPTTTSRWCAQVCDRHQVLFIADEVITGFCRTGKWFALEHWNVQPDILSFAKGVSSGYLPLGGIMVSKADQGGHGRR